MSVKSREEFIALLRTASPTLFLPSISSYIKEDVSLIQNMALVWQAVKENGEQLTEAEQEEFIQLTLDACESIFTILYAAKLYDEEQGKSG